MDKVQAWLDKVGHDLDKYPILCSIEDKTNCPKQYLVVAAFSLLLTCLLTGVGADLVW